LFLHILFIYSTPTLIKDIRTWEKEFFKKSSISNDQRNIEFRDFAVAFGEICGGQLKAADQLDRIAQAQAKQKDKDEYRSSRKSRRRRKSSRSSDSDSDDDYNRRRNRPEEVGVEIGK